MIVKNIILNLDPEALRSLDLHLFRRAKRSRFCCFQTSFQRHFLSSKKYSSHFQAFDRWKQARLSQSVASWAIALVPRVLSEFKSKMAACPSAGFMCSVKRPIPIYCIVLLSHVLLSQVGSLFFFCFILYDVTGAVLHRTWARSNRSDQTVIVSPLWHTMLPCTLGRMELL